MRSIGRLVRSHQSGGVEGTEALTIHERLLDLFLRCHHKRAILHDRLVERLSSDLLTTVSVHGDHLINVNFKHTKTKSVLSSTAETEIPVSLLSADRTSV
jgi:hypothetical protein